MSEAWKSFRYTLPGLAAILPFLMALTICQSDWYPDMWKTLVASNVDILGFGSIVIVFLTSGALGFLFTNIYWALYWCPGINRALAINHCPFFRRMRNIVEVRRVTSGGDGKTAPINDDLSRIEAWRILTQYWHSLKVQKTDGCVAGVDGMQTRLTNVTHTLGGAVLGSFLSYIVWVGLWISHGTRDRLSTMLAIAIIWLVLMGMLLVARYWTQRSLQALAHSTLATHLKGELADKQDRKGPVVTLYYMG